MQELEAWYLGDPDALLAATMISARDRDRMIAAAKFRQSDRMTNAKQEFRRLYNEGGQLLAARSLAPHLDPDRNRSVSFKAFVDGARSLLGD